MDEANANTYYRLPILIENAFGVSTRSGPFALLLRLLLLHLFQFLLQQHLLLLFA
jgi:hypothetical protein